jgi:hypothetical protein
MTAAKSATKRPQGRIVAGKFAAAALVIFLTFAGFLATAQRAGADTGIPASGATGAMADSATGVPPGSTVVPPPVAGNGTPAAPVDLAQPAAQDSATTQAATADAAAAQPQQSNGIATTRTDSSGGETASQQNDLSVAGAAANDAATSQAAGSTPPPTGAAPAETSQQATTDEAADAAAAAVQPQQSNVVIIIRINSPGDDLISQTNTVSVVAVGANQGSTSQNPAPAATSGTATTNPQGSSPGSAATPSTGTTDPQGSSPGSAATASTSAQPAQSASATLQPQQTGDAVQQPSPQAMRAISLLVFSAGSNADAPATENQATSPTTSAGPNQSGGAAGRSGVSGASAAGAEGASGASIGSDTPSVERARHGVDATSAHSSGGSAVASLRHRVASWLGRTSFAARPQLATESAGGMNLGILTLTALLVGLLGWALLTWMPLSRS